MAGEPANDGPAGAAVLVAGGNVNGLICSSPRSEADYVAFDVAALGDTWDLSLGWSGTNDLDLQVFDSQGTQAPVPAAPPRPAPPPPPRPSPVTVTPPPLTPPAPKPTPPPPPKPGTNSSTPGDGRRPHWGPW